MTNFYCDLIETGTHCLFKYEGNEEKIVIPDNSDITVVFDDVFKGHTEITEISFSEGITDIGGFVADGCFNLKKVSLPSTLERFWQYTFVRCGIEEITVPGSVKHISSFVFQQCNMLKKVIIEEGTEEICSWAFKDCPALTDIFIPKTCTKISEKAFESCPNIQVHYA